MELIGGVWRKLHQVSSLSVDANQSFVILNGGAIKKEYRSILYEMLAPFMFHQCTSMFEETRDVGHCGFVLQICTMMITTATRRTTTMEPTHRLHHQCTAVGAVGARIPPL